MRTDHNERVQILDIRGLNARTVKEALHELHDLGAEVETGRTMYHGIITPRAHEQLTDDQRKIAVERMAEKMGLENQPYIVVGHRKDGREHFHVLWSRIDLDNMRGISDSHNYRKHEELARGLEIEFGHELTRGAHVRDKTREARPERTPTHAEMQQAHRTGITAQEATRLVTDAWKRTRTGVAFAEAVEQEGFILARGDRRDFVLIDQAGGLHGLGRRLDGVKAAQVRERLSDIDPAQLPDAIQAKHRAKELRLAAELENRRDFISPAERIRADELKREREAKGGAWSRVSHNEQEILNAVLQLERMGSVTHVRGTPGSPPQAKAPAMPLPDRPTPAPLPPAPPQSDETVMQKLDREARERGDPELKIRIGPTPVRVLSLELERPTRKPVWRPGDP